MTRTALVIGAGPAGLMAAERLSQNGIKTVITEAKPSVGRKFLMAGKSGLNITNACDDASFLAAYENDAGFLSPMIQKFGAAWVQDWVASLGVPMFVGSTGRVFPTMMKASPLLRAWINRLEGQGVDIRTRHRWTGWDGPKHHFDTPNGPVILTADAVVFAFGGASWSKLGSDGAWAHAFHENNIQTVQFQGSNQGLSVDWSPHMQKHFGTPVKSISLTSGTTISMGEIVVSEQGLEGGGLYALSRALRESGSLSIDLKPNWSLDRVTEALSRPWGKASLSNVLRKSVKLDPVKIALLQEFHHPLPRAPKDLARLIKDLKLSPVSFRPMDQAISTVGGISFDHLTPDLMLSDHMGVFCAGEMIDWDAPTGGYLLTACLATGAWAGDAAASFIKRMSD